MLSSYEIMKRFYEEKLKLMDEETSRFESERQKLVRELEEVERRSEDEQKGVHQVGQYTQSHYRRISQ